MEGYENEYLNSKEMLNSCYGMCVTSPLREEFTFDIGSGWNVSRENENENLIKLLKNNNSERNEIIY